MKIIHSPLLLVFMIEKSYFYKAAYRDGEVS